LSASNAAKANFEEKICVLCEEKRPMQYDITPVDMEKDSKMFIRFF